MRRPASGWNSVQTIVQSTVQTRTGRNLFHGSRATYLPNPLQFVLFPPIPDPGGLTQRDRARLGPNRSRGSGEGGLDAEVEVHGRTDRDGVAAGGGGNAGGGDLQEAWSDGADVLPVEEEVWWAGRPRAPGTPAAT